MANHHLSNEEILTALLEYTLEMAATHGILRIFARVEDEIPEIELFQRTGFQRYARELTYVYDPDCSISGFKRAQADPELPSLRWWRSSPCVGTLSTLPLGHPTAGSGGRTDRK